MNMEQRDATQAKEGQQPPEAGRGKESFSLRGSGPSMVLPMP